MSTLWNAIYRRNRWSCSPELGFAGSGWAVFYTWQLLIEKQEGDKKKKNWSDCGVCVAPVEQQTQRDQPGWSEWENQGGSNKLSFCVIQWAVIAGMGIPGGAAAAACAGNVGLEIFLGWFRGWAKSSRGVFVWRAWGQPCSHLDPVSWAQEAPEERQQPRGAPDYIGEKEKFLFPGQKKKNSWQSCPGHGWNSHPWRDWKATRMWHLGTGVGFGLGDHGGLFPPKGIQDYLSKAEFLSKEHQFQLDLSQVWAAGDVQSRGSNPPVTKGIFYFLPPRVQDLVLYQSDNLPW